MERKKEKQTGHVKDQGKIPASQPVHSLETCECSSLLPSFAHMGGAAVVQLDFGRRSKESILYHSTK